MRFETTPAFERDYKRLRPEHKATFRRVIPAFSAACDAFEQRGGGYQWPAALRVAPMKGTTGIWEMTWSFASPDGRATFELVPRDGSTLARWRQVGDHDVFTSP